MAQVNTNAAAQRCIEPACSASYSLRERLYLCPRCGGLLEIGKPPESIGAPETLRISWKARLSSPASRDRSGVWRYRELLPFADDAPIVTLAEGNTPLY